LKFGVDKFANFVAVVGRDQLGEPRFGFVFFAHHNNADVAAVCCFLGNGISFWIQACRHGVIGVNGRGIQVIERARQLRGIEFDKLEFFRVAGDIQRCGFETRFGLKLYHPLSLQQQQDAPAVGRVVGNAKACAFFQVGQLFDLFRVNANGEIDGIGSDDKGIAAVFDLCVQIRFVLITVGIEIARGEGGIGLYVPKARARLSRSWKAAP